MQIHKKLAIVALPLLLIGGCASVSLSEKASKVQIQRQDSTLLSTCTKIGPVNATSSAQIDPYTADADARIKIREATSDRGGDTVVLLNTDVIMPRVSVQGVAFKCY